MRLIFLIPLILMGCSALGGKEKPEISSRGSVCGDPSIKGEIVGPVTSSTPGCGIADAVKVYAIGDIALSQHSVMECDTARTLKGWVENDLDRVVGIMGGGVSSLKVASHYACRTRNSKRGARISEHGKGRAIDIAAVRLEDGTELSVLQDWGNGRKGRMLKKLHAGACGPFGTVLGPNSDVHHKDHFHFDIAKHGNGPYCR